MCCADNCFVPEWKRWRQAALVRDMVWEYSCPAEARVTAHAFQINIFAPSIFQFVY